MDVAPLCFYVFILTLGFPLSLLEQPYKDTG